MLSQLIVVDFAKGRHPVIFDELTKAYDRVISWVAHAERPEFWLSLYNYDKEYANKADLRVVFVFDQIPEPTLPAVDKAQPNPWVQEIDLAYRTLMTATLEQVLHSGVYTYCLYKTQVEDPVFTQTLDWVKENIVAP